MQLRKLKWLHPTSSRRLSSWSALVCNSPKPTFSLHYTTPTTQPSPWVSHTLPVSRNACTSCTLCCISTTMSSRRLRSPISSPNTTVCVAKFLSTLRTPRPMRSEYSDAAPRALLTQVSRCGIYCVSMTLTGDSMQVNGTA